MFVCFIHLYIYIYIKQCFSVYCINHRRLQSLELDRHLLSPSSRPRG